MSDDLTKSERRWRKRRLFRQPRRRGIRPWHAILLALLLASGYIFGTGTVGAAGLFTGQVLKSIMGSE